MYKRILLKLSGEALKEDESLIIKSSKIKEMANIIKSLHDNGIEVCVVIGAGNIWRGKIAESLGMPKEPGDYMGMLGTMINAVALSCSLNEIGVQTLVTSALTEVPNTAYMYTKESADKALKEGKIVFLSGGIGKPNFTTDTAATKRAIELNCEAIFMGKNGVEGIYDKDPNKFKDAKFFKEITFNEIIKLQLQVMDMSAVKLIKDKNIVLRVFSMNNSENFLKVAMGEPLGTICKKGD